MSNTVELRGRTVIVTGASSGIGAATARALAATKSAVNMLSAVARKELEGTGVSVSVVLPSTTATEFGAGRFTSGQHTRPGLIAHSPDYVAGIILRALRTGEERIDIPHGNEQPELASLPTH
jgi:short-subunit dehydrogenase